MTTPPFHITGLGRAVPDGVLTNADLEARMDTSDQWIRERTGIHERRVGGSCTELAVEAAQAAVDQAGNPAVSMVLVATSTSDEAIPGCSTAVAGRLGLDCGTVDLNGACAGFVYALVAAGGFLDPASGSVLVVGVDVMSRITDPDDRGTAILFGDGAGAAVLQPAAPGSDVGLVAWHAGTDASTHDILLCRQGGTIEMAGQAVFKVAVRAATASAFAALETAGIDPADVDLFVPHQANQRITDALAGRLGLGPERVVSTIADTGNASAGTIPYALSVAHEEGRLHDGSIVLMSGFGAGMTWATGVVRWSSGPS